MTRLVNGSSRSTSGPEHVKARVRGYDHAQRTDVQLDTGEGAAFMMTVTTLINRLLFGRHFRPQIGKVCLGMGMDKVLLSCVSVRLPACLPA